MQFSQLQDILENTKLSAEQLAPALGISNMTIRRWKKERPTKVVPKAYQRLLTDGVQQLLREGLIAADSSWAQEFIASSPSFSITSALNGMGVTEKDLAKSGSQKDRLINFLRLIGFSPKNRSEVDSKTIEIKRFKKIDGSWKRNISVLLKVIASKKLGQMEKMIAYGALFYLLCPFDLIPDQIPVFGYMDDFALLTLAASYYIGKKKSEGDRANTN